ncbi:hypothetical protein DL770_001060 [Monosporascus sp. CRB-9-2]|nr:hypothetical protein DL770_001060 [Monosporascus sp. CRB-9-2]
MLEITDGHLRSQFIASSLRGWFLGVEDGRVSAPTVMEAQWDSILREAGFSGVDASANSGFSVITTQAVDYRVMALLILGGRGKEVAEVAGQTRELLMPCTSSITCIQDLDPIDRQTFEVPIEATVLCLSDLEELIFKDMTERHFEGLQTPFRNAKKLLWVTQGYRDENPEVNMVVGLGRSLLQEFPDLEPQFVDIAPTDIPNPTLFAGCILRLVRSSFLGYEGIVWTTEHEVAVEKGVNELLSWEPHQDDAVRLQQLLTVIIAESIINMQEDIDQSLDNLLWASIDASTTVRELFTDANGLKSLNILYDESDRRPKVNPGIVERLKRKGAEFRIMALDGSEKKALEGGHQDICVTMLPIGGVANAAMVLQGKSFDNMTWENFKKSSVPKSREAVTSMSSSIRTTWTSSYSKEGQYHGALETDFHDLLAEATVTGRAGSHQGVEIITGIGQDTKVSWHVQPRFSAYVNKDTSVREKRQRKASGDVRGNVAAVENDEEAMAALEDEFSSVLQIILQINADKIDKQSPLMDLGVDSLTVPVRTWFKKQLSVDIPVLKILSDASVRYLCRDVFAKLHIESDTGRDESAAAEPLVAQNTNC